MILIQFLQRLLGGRQKLLIYEKLQCKTGVVCKACIQNYMMSLKRKLDGLSYFLVHAMYHYYRRARGV